MAAEITPSLKVLNPSPIRALSVETAAAAMPCCSNTPSLSIPESSKPRPASLQIRRFTTIEHGVEIDIYWTSACTRCAMKPQCTTSQYRRIRRWKHESVLDAMQERLDRRPEIMRIRRETAEHPFGTIKLWMGSTHPGIDRVLALFTPLGAPVYLLLIRIWAGSPRCLLT